MTLHDSNKSHIDISTSGGSPGKVPFGIFLSVFFFIFLFFFFLAVLVEKALGAGSQNQLSCSEMQ